MGFSRQEYWSGLPFPSPEESPDPGIEPRSPALQADSLLIEPPGKPSKDKVGDKISMGSGRFGCVGGYKILPDRGNVII